MPRATIPDPDPIELPASRMTADGQLLVTATQLIGTNLVTLCAYEPDAGHTTITHRHGRYWGSITSRPLPDEIRLLEAGSPERIGAVIQHTAELEHESRQLIYDLYPEVLGFTGSYGRVQVERAEVREVTR